jgi:hypothetical protein
MSLSFLHCTNTEFSFILHDLTESTSRVFFDKCVIHYYKGTWKFKINASWKRWSGKAFSVYRPVLKRKCTRQILNCEFLTVRFILAHFFGLCPSVNIILYNLQSHTCPWVACFQSHGLLSPVVNKYTTCFNITRNFAFMCGTVMFHMMLIIHPDGMPLKCKPIGL